MFRAKPRQQVSPQGVLFIENHSQSVHHGCPATNQHAMTGVWDELQVRALPAACGFEGEGQVPVRRGGARCRPSYHGAAAEGTGAHAAGPRVSHHERVGACAVCSLVTRGKLFAPASSGAWSEIQCSTLGSAPLRLCFSPCRLASRAFNSCVRQS